MTQLYGIIYIYFLKSLFMDFAYSTKFKLFNGKTEKPPSYLLVFLAHPPLERKKTYILLTFFRI